MDKYIFYICQAIDQKYFSLLSLQFLWKNQYSFTPLKNNSTGNYKILKELYIIFKILWNDISVCFLNYV